MKKIRYVILASLMLMPLQVSVWADGGQREQLEDAVVSPHFFRRAPARLVQGVVNLAFSWTALFYEPYHAAKTGDPSFSDGVFRGLTYPFGYAFLGLYDIGTFWVPGPEKLPTDMAVKENVLDW